MEDRHRSGLRDARCDRSDLGAFKEGGGKIIYWTGWSDPALTALGTIGYYEQVEATDHGVRDYARLFMLPGVLHCAGGRGPDQVDWLETIRMGIILLT